MPTYEENHQWNLGHYNEDAMRYGRTRAPQEPMEPLAIEAGQKVKFYGDRRWWGVRASGGDYVVLTRDAEFGRGTLYTVICWSQGRRGPHNSWGYGATTPEKINAMLKALVVGDIELSERHSVRLDIERVK